MNHLKDQKLAVEKSGSVLPCHAAMPTKTCWICEIPYDITKSNLIISNYIIIYNLKHDVWYLSRCLWPLVQVNAPPPSRRAVVHLGQAAAWLQTVGFVGKPREKHIKKRNQKRLVTRLSFSVFHRPWGTKPRWRRWGSPKRRRRRWWNLHPTSRPMPRSCSKCGIWWPSVVLGGWREDVTSDNRNQTQRERYVRCVDMWAVTVSCWSWLSCAFVGGQFVYQTLSCVKLCSSHWDEVISMQKCCAFGWGADEKRCRTSKEEEALLVGLYWTNA